MNHDNRSDIIVAYGSDDESISSHSYALVSILFNNDDGTFNAIHIIKFNTRWHCLMNVGDVNGDGELDIIIVVPNYDVTKIKVFLNNGHNDFTEQQTVFENRWSTFMRVADLNDDNKLDIILAKYESNHISTMWGTGNGTFTEQMEYNTNCTGFEFEVANLNDDDIADIVITCYREMKIILLFNNGNDMYTLDELNNLEWKLWNFLVTDINNDGKIDLILLYVDPTNGISIHLNIGNGKFDQPTFYTTDDILSTASAVGDVNNDQKVDIIFNHLHSIVILFQTDNITFTDEHFYSLYSSVSDIVIDDIDNNNQFDIIIKIETGIGVFLTYCN